MLYGVAIGSSRGLELGTLARLRFGPLDGRWRSLRAPLLQDFLEAVQRNRVDGSLDGLIHITADAAQLQARRMLTSLIGAEQAR